MTDYKKVKVRLRAALKEYKKGEHDQLTTEFARHLIATPCSSECYEPATWEEVCNSLIRSVSIVQGREKSGFYDGNPKADIHQENQCGTCKSIDRGKAMDPCYGCNDFDKWEQNLLDTSE